MGYSLRGHKESDTTEQLTPSLHVREQLASYQTLNHFMKK